MSASSDGKKDASGFWASFKEGYEEGYKEEDKKIREDTAPLEDKIAEGIVTGVVETIAQPFKLIRSFFK